MDDVHVENNEPYSDEDIKVLADFFTVLVEIERDMNKKGISVNDIE